MPKEESTQVVWRIPAALHEEIKTLADVELRTLNAQAIKLLKEALAARKARGRKGP